MYKVTWILGLFFRWTFINYYGVSSTVLPCTENRTDLCIQNLATFITLDKPRFVNEAELERLCRAAEDGQKCSSDFLRSSSCVNSEDQLPISLEIGRSQAVSQMLCNIGGYMNDPDFRKLYLKHSSCIDEHKKSINDCFVSANIVGDPELEVVKNSTKTTEEKQADICCPVVQYIECSENAIQIRCGAESKTIVEKILLKVAGKQLDEFCKNIDVDFPNNPSVCVSIAIAHVANFSVCFLLIFVIISSYMFL